MTRRDIIVILTLWALWLVMPQGPLQALADEIRLVNGDRLTGTLVRMDKDLLILDTTYAGTVKIRRTSIQSIRTDNAASLRLTDGKRIEGRIVSVEKERATVVLSDHKGVITVGAQTITDINPPPVQWEGGVTLAGNQQTGNTDRTGASAVLEGIRRSEQDRIRMQYTFNHGAEHGNMTAENHFGALKYDYYFTKTVYSYLATDLLNDRYRDIALRTTVGPGLGYQLWEDPGKALGLEAGITYVYESRYDAANERFLAARLAAIFRYNLGEYLIFTDQLTYYPSLENRREFNLRNEGTLSVPLGAKWSMRLGHVWDHASQAPEGRDRNDTTATGGLQYKF